MMVTTQSTHAQTPLLSVSTTLSNCPNNNMLVFRAPLLAQPFAVLAGVRAYAYAYAWPLRYKPSELPVIILSAKSRDKAIVEGLQRGANDYITKPFNRSELIARIEMQLRLKHAWHVERCLLYTSPSPRDRG